ncbi:MAG: DMT family transporter [Clostridia bacterium]|nr:DMT family transporter [Clostridia bacterium]
MKNKKLLGNILLILTAVIWGTAFVAQRAGMDKIEPLTFNASRMALGAVAVGLVAFLGWIKEKRTGAGRTEEEQKQYNKNTVIGGVLCGCCLAGASILQQIGLVYTTAGKAGFITALYILIVPVIGFIFLKRKNTWIVWAAVLIGLVGMFLLCISEEFRLSKGDALICGCAFVFSFHIITCDHFVKKGNPVRMSAIQFATATVISTAAAFIAEQPSMDKIISAAVPILYCGLVSGGVGYTLQIVAQKFTDPTVASLLMSMESVFAVIAGVLLLHESMSVREIIGCVVMFVAIILVQIPLPKRKNT